jgi:hypothetical protein
MSFEILQSEVRALPVAARRKLMAFMVALQDETRDGYAARLAQKIDDQSPEHWLSAEDCERQLGLADGSK